MAERGPVMSRLDSRLRAEEALRLRGRERSWQEIADELGYRSRGAAQLAVKRHMERTAPESPEQTRRYMVESTRYAYRKLEAGFNAAVERGDDENVVKYNREMVRNRDQLGRLTGTFAPERTEVDVRLDPAAFVESIRSRALAIVEANADKSTPAIDAKAKGNNTIDAEVVE